jgi:glutamine kinase
MQSLSKAQTLKSLENCIQSAIVLPQFCFSVFEWQQNAEEVIARFFKEHLWSTDSLVVRSSGAEEDSDSASLAGQYTSVLGVSDLDSLKLAIEQVIASFKLGNKQDQVFVQPMVENALYSGVAFTTEPSTNAPYYVINYSKGADTESITSGKSNDSVLYISKFHYDKKTLPDWVVHLIKLCEELQKDLGSNTLDIEFAVDQEQKLYLFQVRPLIVNLRKKVSDSEHSLLLTRLEKTVARLLKRHPYLNGERSVLGVMPDWNPAEIIGIRPKQLALSLYKELVTDSIWAYQRDNYGYKQLRSFPLMVSLCGLPYIDVRVSFNSFIPADVNDELAEKLVTYYIQQLENRPEKHDKIEFDIIFSCFTLDLDSRLDLLKGQGFNQHEINLLAVSLRELTNKIINPHGLWTKDIAKIEKLTLRRQNINNSNLTKTEKIVWLLEDCKRYGTLPFAGLARAGFIAIQLLKSMVTEGILTQVDCDNFLRNLNTVSSRMAEDRENLSHSAFLQAYGHLRPGTYDIMSPRYDQAPERYFDMQTELQNCKSQNESTPFLLSLEQLANLKQRLDSSGIEHDVMSLFQFIRGAIEGREYAKFEFTKSLSDAIQLVEEVGQELNIDKESLAFLDIKAFYDAYSSADDMERLLKDSISLGQSRYAETESIILPPLIVNPHDVYQFCMPEGEPNYITLKSVTAGVTSCLEEKMGLAGKIVFIPAADPGFDWIFSANIAGFITQYGGANSHMAIRAGELGIPAVIGSGEVLYRKWQKAQLLELDAANRRVVVLK